MGNGFFFGIVNVWGKGRDVDGGRELRYARRIAPTQHPTRADPTVGLRPCTWLSWPQSTASGTWVDPPTYSFRGTGGILAGGARCTLLQRVFSIGAFEEHVDV